MSSSGFIRASAARVSGLRLGVSALALALAGAMGTLGWSGSAAALEFRSGDFTGSFDTTLSLGGTWRVQDRDRGLIGRANGGTAYSLNGDDGNQNYDQGLASVLAKATHELEVRYKQNFGVFLRGYYFYDFINSDRDSTERTDLSDAALDRIGRGGRLLDAYAFAKFDAGSMPIDIRVGNQVLSWGESTFIPNGINVINPADLSKLRAAGSEIKEALLPVPMISGSIGLTDNVRLEGFYQFRHEVTELEPAGTMFSTNDFVSPGGRNVFLGFGLPPSRDIPPFTPGTAVARLEDREPSNGGQFGIAARAFLPDLNDSEVGLYFVNYHSRTPIISARTGRVPTSTNPQVAQAQYVGSARYFAEYPEDIKLLGTSFNTSLPGGFSFAGEFTYRMDQPLQVDDVELLYAALSPINPAAFGRSQLGRFGFNQDISGYRRKDVSTAQFSLTKAIGQVLGADQAVVLGEVGFTKVWDMDGEGRLRYEGPGTYTSGNPFFTGARIQPYTTTSGFADSFSWGYRLLARLEYNNVIGGVNLVPTVAFAHDVSGTTPAPLSTFVEGRKAITLGLTATYLNSWAADIGYTMFFGGGDNNLLHDRDYASVALRYSF